MKEHANPLPALRMVGGDDVEEDLSRTAKTTLPGGFDAEVDHYIRRGHKRDGKNADSPDTGPILRLSRSGGAAGGRARVEIHVREWAEIMEAVGRALEKLAPGEPWQ